MASLNKVQFIGNMGKDPEMRYTPSGKAVVGFSLAVNRSYKDASGEERKQTDWFNVEAWGKLAEVIHQYTQKGSSLYVEGRLQIDKYEDKDGNMKQATKIVAQTVQFLSRSNGSASQESNDAELPPEDDIPF